MNVTPPISDRTPSSLFELFYDNEVIDHVMAMTYLYALQDSSKQHRILLLFCSADQKTSQQTEAPDKGRWWWWWYW